MAAPIKKKTSIKSLARHEKKSRKKKGETHGDPCAASAAELSRCSNSSMGAESQVPTCVNAGSPGVPWQRRVLRLADLRGQGPRSHLISQKPHRSLYETQLNGASASGQSAQDIAISTNCTGWEYTWASRTGAPMAPLQKGSSTTYWRHGRY